MTAALDVRQLTKRFGATHALRGVPSRHPASRGSIGFVSGDLHRDLP